MKRYESKFSEGRLIPDESKNKWANTSFKKELSKLNVNDIVWLEDNKGDYHGYYIVTPKRTFKSIGATVTASVFKKYGVEEDDIPVLKI